jgi:hypothetical protein
MNIPCTFGAIPTKISANLQKALALNYQDPIGESIVMGIILKPVF